MSLRSRFFTLLTVAGATVAFSTIGFAQSTPATTSPTDNAATEKSEHQWGKGQGKRGDFHGRHEGMRHGGGMGMMLRGIDLTDAQKTQIQSIMAANKPSTESRDEMKTLMMAKRSGTLTDAQNERLTAIRTDGQAKGRAIHEQILAVLTPDQKAKIDARKAEMKARMQERKALRQQKTPAAAAATDTPTN
ncbi:MAG: Spy/CpxP family protein refolding chaperone [Acidobacteriota bacterium]